MNHPKVHLDLAGPLNHPKVQAALHLFAERLTMQACQGFPLSGDPSFLEQVEDLVAGAVEGAVRDLAVERWPSLRGVAGL